MARTRTTKTTKKTPARTEARKKAPTRKAATKSAVIKQPITQPTRSAIKSEPRTSRTFSLKRSYLTIALGVLLVAGLLYLFRSLFVVATVNGMPISRLALMRELEQQGGRRVLDTLVRNKLIEQEASKQHVSVSTDEIDKEVKNIENNLSKQGQKLDDALKIQGLTRQQLRDQIRVEKLVEKVIGKDIKVSSQEIDQYVAQNKDALGTSDPKEQRKVAEQQLKQQKLGEKYQTWIAELQKKAKVHYFVTY